MALFTQSPLGSDFDRPNSFVGDPVSPNDPISLPLSDGTVVQVFDTKRTALSILKQTRTVGKTWNVYASEDVLCMAVPYTNPHAVADLKIRSSHIGSKKNRSLDPNITK